MKKTALAIALAALILMLSACAASGAVYSRVQVGDRIDLTLKRLNGRFDQTLYAKAGDSGGVRVRRTSDLRRMRSGKRSLVAIAGVSRLCARSAFPQKRLFQKGFKRQADLEGHIRLFPAQ